MFKKIKKALLRRMTTKQRIDTADVLIRHYKKNPFVDIGWKALKGRKAWFDFVSQLAITGLLYYVAHTTGNLLVKILFVISISFWFLISLGFMYSIANMIHRYAWKRIKIQWIFWGVILGTLIVGQYIVLQFLSIFKVLH